MSKIRWAAVAATVALAIGGLALPGNALGQSVNVADFSCGTTPFSVNRLREQEWQLPPRLRTKPPLQRPLRAA
jgi:hypothetical protein